MAASMDKTTDNYKSNHAYMRFLKMMDAAERGQLREILTRNNFHTLKYAIMKQEGYLKTTMEVCIKYFLFHFTVIMARSSDCQKQMSC